MSDIESFNNNYSRFTNNNQQSNYKEERPSYYLHTSLKQRDFSNSSQKNEYGYDSDGKNQLQLQDFDNNQYNESRQQQPPNILQTVQLQGTDNNNTYDNQSFKNISYHQMKPSQQNPLDQSVNSIQRLLPRQISDLNSGLVSYPQERQSLTVQHKQHDSRIIDNKYGNNNNHSKRNSTIINSFLGSNSSYREEKQQLPLLLIQEEYRAGDDNVQRIGRLEDKENHENILRISKDDFKKKSRVMDSELDNLRSKIDQLEVKLNSHKLTKSQFEREQPREQHYSHRKGLSELHKNNVQELSPELIDFDQIVQQSQTERRQQDIDLVSLHNQEDLSKSKHGIKGSHKPKPLKEAILKHRKESASLRRRDFHEMMLNDLELSNERQRNQHHHHNILQQTAKQCRDAKMSTTLEHKQFRESRNSKSYALQKNGTIRSQRQDSIGDEQVERRSRSAKKTKTEKGRQKSKSKKKDFNSSKKASKIKEVKESTIQSAKSKQRDTQRETTNTLRDSKKIPFRRPSENIPKQMTTIDPLSSHPHSKQEHFAATTLQPCSETQLLSKLDQKVQKLKRKLRDKDAEISSTLTENTLLKQQMQEAEKIMKKQRKMLKLKDRDIEELQDLNLKYKKKNELIVNALELDKGQVTVKSQVKKRNKDKQ